MDHIVEIFDTEEDTLLLTYSIVPCWCFCCSTCHDYAMTGTSDLC